MKLWKPKSPAIDAAVNDPVAPAPAPPAPADATDAPDATDEGIPFAWVDAITIVNLSADWYDQRRRELHVGGRSFSHVAEAAQGRLYRYDH